MLTSSQAAGVTVKLVNVAGIVVGTTMTDSTGAFAFTEFAPGGYQVAYVAPKGTFLETGSEATAATGLTPVVSVAAGQSLALPIETLLSNPSTIDGMIYRYGTGDPTWGAGAPGVVVTLLNSTGVAIATATTTTGWFAFAGLAAGTYQLKYAPPAGEIISSGGSVNPATGLTASVTLAAGQTLAVAKAGVVPTGSLSGEVTLAGAGKAGVTVALINASGTAIATTTTSSAGAFTFSGLIAGGYQVRYIAPIGDALSATSAASSTIGLTPVISLSAGQVFSLAPEVLTGPTSITGSVVYEGAGQAGVAVAVLNSDGTIVATTTTTATGTFLFSGLSGGSYRVRYSPPTSELLQPGSLADVTTGTSAAISLVANQAMTLGAETLVDAPATISGNVLYKGVADPGIAVALLNSAGAVIATTKTSSAGSFTFSNVAVGSYKLLYTAPAGKALAASGPANLLSGLTASVAVDAGQTLHMSTETMVASLNDVGVYVGYPGISTYNSSLSQYATTVGAAPSYADLFIDNSQPMAQWVNGSKTEATELRASTDGTTVIPVVSVPLISTVSDGLTKLQNFAAITSGADDSTWLGIVQAYKAQGYTTIDLRIGEEQNGNWYPWSISTTAEAQAYISAFDHISALVHNVAGITVNVVWNPATVTSSAVPTEATYPGNAYVDIIGIDTYDSVYPLSLYDWSTHTVDATLAEWEANPVNLEHYWNYPDANVYYPTGTGAGFGLADAIAFAKASGKPLALAETGAGGSSASPSTDDALFPQYLATTLLSSGVQIAFANIWDKGTDTFSDGSKPNEATAWGNFVKEMNQGDPGPSASTGTTIVGHGQTVNLSSQVTALIIPGKTGDTETVTAISTRLGTVTLGSGGAITYTAPANGTDILTYTVTDQLGDVGIFTDTIVINPGPTLTTGSTSVMQGATVALGTAIAALITPGIAGTTESITAVSAAKGTAILGASDVISYTAPFTTGSDTLNYTVTDQYGDTATGSYAVSVTSAPATTTGVITGKVAVGVGTGTAIGGVTVSLLDSSAKVLATATTNSTGAYSFTGLAAGTYTVRETPPIGYAALAGSSTTTAALTVTAGVTATAAVLKLAGVGSITGTELLGTTPVAGATVTLLADNANGYYTAATTTTNSAGSYSFSNLYSLNYQVKFTTPSGDTLQSGPANSSTGVTNPITITGTPGQTVALAAETLTKTSTAVTTGASTSASTSTQTSASTATTTGVITGKVAVGVGTGTAIGGVTVSLLDSSAKVLATATTNSTGAYSFTGLAAGTYTVRETPPIGYAALAGSSTTTAALTVTAGVTATAAVLKLAGVGSITGTELLGTTPVAGATVTLLADNANGYYTAATTTTNSAGSYSFSNLYSLNYQVKFTTPSGDTLQSGPANSSTGVTNPITITGTPGQTVALAAEVAATNTTTLSGIGQAVTRIDGNYTVIGTASNSRITLGNGNQTILLTGAGDTITIGSGTSSITAKGGNEIIHTGGGSTTISVTAGGNLLDAGPGMNFITTDGAGSDTFMLNSAEQGLTTISGFSMSHSDVLDLNRTLAGLNVAKDLSNLSNFVTSVVSDGSTTLMVDPTGTHGTASSIAVLKGVSATVDQLITGGHISLT